MRASQKQPWAVNKSCWVLHPCLGSFLLDPLCACLLQEQLAQQVIFSDFSDFADDTAVATDATDATEDSGGKIVRPSVALLLRTRVNLCGLAYSCQSLCFLYPRPLPPTTVSSKPVRGDEMVCGTPTQPIAPSCVHLRCAACSTAAGDDLGAVVLRIDRGTTTQRVVGLFGLGR